MTIQIFHNPRCSKSRQTLQLIEEKGISPQVVEYLKTPLSAAEIKQLVEKLGISTHDLIRNKEAEYKEANLSANSDEATLLAAMAKYPRLIERPIVVNGDAARIGRPPESVLEIL